MRVVIRGHRLPGLTCEGGAMVRRRVHVGLQVGREPVDLVPGDAASAEWTTEVELVERDGLRDFRGPAVQGKRGERFLYLTWGEIGEPNFMMFRRAKLMLADLPHLEMHPVSAIATVDLTDEKGGPRCGRLKPPSLQWDVSV